MNRKLMPLEAFALIAFFATMPVYSPNVVPLQECLQDNEIMGHFVTPLLVSVAGASAILFAHAATSATGFKRAFLLYSKASPFVYAACMTYFILASVRVTPAHSTAVTLCGIACGLCLPYVAIWWGKRLEPLRLQQALLLVCVVCASTAIINWVFSILAAMPLAVLSIALVALGSFFPPALNRVEHTKDPGSKTAKTRPASCSDNCLQSAGKESVLPNRNEKKTDPLLLPRFMSVLVPALIGLSVFAFHMGVSRESVLDSVSTEILGNLFAALVLAPLCFVKSRKPVSVLLFSGVAPVAAAMLLSYMAIANDFEVLGNFTSTGIYTFFCMIAQISLALGIAGTHAREFSARMIWSGFTLLFAIFSISGISLGALLSDKQPLMPQTITALYCAYLIVQSVGSFWKNEAGHSSSSAHANEEHDYAHRCKKLADDFSLSPREQEISTYLGRGHTCTYIAKMLVISESTVYTHARNIYRKVGIQSKEELIQILASNSE